MSFGNWTRTAQKSMTAATPATPATQQAGTGATVATVATVAYGRKVGKAAPDPADETRALIWKHKPELLAALPDKPPNVTPAAPTIAPDEADLTALVNRVADHHGFTTEQRQEARDIALSDPAAALECFQALAVSKSIPDPPAEARRQRVLAMLAERPGIRYAVVTDTRADPDAVLLTLAIRGQATCELRIPHDRYDPFLLLDLIERHGGTVH